jgi:Bacterial Ig-like domain (group 2)/Electron transfer DM13
MKKVLLAIILASSFAACKKAGEDVPVPPVVTVPERLEITPTTSSILTGQTTQFTLKFYNNLGVLAALPTGIVWSSDNMAIATVSQTGLATAVAVGQANIKATYNTISATAAITVAVNNTVLSTVTITPSTTQEILLNGTVNLSAIGTNLAGGVITGLTYNWMSNASASVQVNSAGMATGLAYGSANITATSNGIQSAPIMVQVIRQGNFTSMNSNGTAKLKIENGTLKLTTSANFYVNPAPPDLRIYLSTSASSIAGAIQIAPLSTAAQTSGARDWNVPSTVSITQYRYAVVWCAQFGGVYGVADFGL